MPENYQYIPQILDQISEIPTESIVSRTVFQDDTIKAILFGFAAGQELSEHTASVPAIIHILEGQVDLTLGEEDKISASAGAWVHMPANLSHSLFAQTGVKMLLLLIQKNE